MNVKSYCAAAALAGSALAFIAVPASAEPRVVVSVAPVHAIVADIMAGVGKPHLLLPAGASPHTYSLRPSDARRLNEADIVFWVGEALETFLERPLTALSADARVIELLEADGVERLPGRAGGAWHAHEDPGDDHAGDEHAAREHEEYGDEEHAHEEDGHDDHGHAHGDIDPHFWLSVGNARAIARIAADALAGTDPANAGTYAANARRVDTRLAALRAEIDEIVAPVRAKPYIVFHDAYRYFEHDFTTNTVGAITVSPDRQPGARRLVEIRETLEKTGAACVFREPQFPPALADTVTRGTTVRTGVLDPIGAGLEPGPDLYPTLMRNLANALSACLSGQS